MNQNKNKPSVSNEVDSIIAGLTADKNSVTLSLDDFTLKEKMDTNDMVWSLISKLYDRPEFYNNVLGCILNGVVTSKKSAFLLSRNLLQKYLQIDPNFDRVYVNGTQFKKIVDTMTDQFLSTGSASGFLVCLAKPGSRKAKRGQSAGVYTVGNPRIRELLPWITEESIQNSSTLFEYLLEVPSKSTPVRLGQGPLGPVRLGHVKLGLSNGTETINEESNLISPIGETFSNNEFVKCIRSDTGLATGAIYLVESVSEDKSKLRIVNKENEFPIEYFEKYRHS